jgi:hypothetical protein
MAASEAQKQAYINAARNAATELWRAQVTLQQLQDEWNALDYGNTLLPADFTGDNEGLVASNIGAVVFDTSNSIQTLVFNVGSATNVARIKR